MKKLREEVFRFAIISGIAFIIDVSLVTILYGVLGFDPFFARLIAIGAATLFAVYWHRHWTFEHTKEGSILYQQATYAATQLISHTLNMGIYLSLIEHNEFWQKWPSLAVAVGSAIAVVVTFCLAKLVVFRRSSIIK